MRVSVAFVFILVVIIILATLLLLVVTVRGKEGGGVPEKTLMSRTLTSRPMERYLIFTHPLP